MDTRTNAKNGQAGGRDGETRRGASEEGRKEKRKEMVEAKLRERGKRGVRWSEDE